MSDNNVVKDNQKLDENIVLNLAEKDRATCGKKYVYLSEFEDSLSTVDNIFEGIEDEFFCSPEGFFTEKYKVTICVEKVD